MWCGVVVVWCGVVLVADNASVYVLCHCFHQLSAHLFFPRVFACSLLLIRYVAADSVHNAVWWSHKYVYHNPFHPCHHCNPLRLAAPPCHSLAYRTDTFTPRAPNPSREADVVYSAKWNNADHRLPRIDVGSGYPQGLSFSTGVQPIGCCMQRVSVSSGSYLHWLSRWGLLRQLT